MDTTTGGHRVLAEVGGGGLSRTWFVGAAFDRGRFFFGMECIGDPGGCQDLARHRRLMRYRISTGELTKALVPGDALLTLARDGGRATVVWERESAPSGAQCAGVVLTESATAYEVVWLADGEVTFTATRTTGE